MLDTTLVRAHQQAASGKGGTANQALGQIQAAFEQSGIQFIDDDEMGGFGLRMAKKKRKR
jgi:hypothetical protein